MSERLICILCGKAGHPSRVAPALILSKGGHYGHGARCRDVWDCYQTVLAIGEEWPLAAIPRRPEA